MRKPIAWPIAWTLFWLGHFTCVLFTRPTFVPGWVQGRMYFVYNALMFWAMTVQDWGRLKGPWGDPIRSDGDA